MHETKTGTVPYQHRQSSTPATEERTGTDTAIDGATDVVNPAVANGDSFTIADVSGVGVVRIAWTPSPLQNRGRRQRSIQLYRRPILRQKQPT